MIMFIDIDGGYVYNFRDADSTEQIKQNISHTSDRADLYNTHIWIREELKSVTVGNWNGSEPPGICRIVLH